LIELEDDLQRAAVEEANAAVNLAEIRLKQAKKAPIRNEILAKEQAQAIEAARLRVSTLEQQLQAIDELAERRVAAGNESKAGRDRLGELKALLTAETLKLEEINLEDAELTVKLAELAVEQAKSRRRVADEQLARCVMTAPADGKILRINVRAGQIAGVNPLTPTIMFCPDGSVVCRCEIDQEFAARVETGLRAELFPDGRRDEKYVGRVSRVSSWIAPRRSTLDEPFQRNDVRTLEAIVAVDGQVDRLRIGERMRVVLFADRPIDSMIRTAGGADSRSNDRSTAVSAPRIVDNADERAAERLDDLAPVVELSETESSTSDRSGSAKSNVKPVVRAASNRPAAR
jgi:multidrug resistance efflux pump